MNETRRRRRLTHRRQQQRAADLGVRAPRPVTRRPAPFPGAWVVLAETTLRGKYQAGGGEGLVMVQGNKG